MPKLGVEETFICWVTFNMVQEGKEEGIHII